MSVTTVRSATMQNPAEPGISRRDAGRRLGALIGAEIVIHTACGSRFAGVVASFGFTEPDPQQTRTPYVAFAHDLFRNLPILADDRLEVL